MSEEQHENYLHACEIDSEAFGRLCDRYDVPGLVLATAVDHEEATAVDHEEADGTNVEPVVEVVS
jgi:hypothetical protein